MKFLDQFKGAGSRVIPDVNDVADDIASVLPVSDGRDSKIKSFHKSSIDRYQRTKDYWDFWDEKYWNPGPFSNRNKNNMFVAFFSLCMSIVYIILYLGLRNSGSLRFTQDETSFRTVAKHNFDLCNSHLLNIVGSIWLAITTFYCIGNLQRGLLIGWIIGRALLWSNTARSFKLFLHRPHAYVLFDPSNPEWRWLFTSSHLSYWATVVYWILQLLSWVYEWAVVVTYFYYVSLRLPITAVSVPEAMHRINDTVMTTQLNPTRDYTLLQPTAVEWKQTRNKNLFGRPQKMTMENDNRTKPYP